LWTDPFFAFLRELTASLALAEGRIGLVAPRRKEAWLFPWFDVADIMLSLVIVNNDMWLGSGIVQFVLQVSVALFFLLQNLIDLFLQLLAIIANRTSRSKSLGLRVTARRLLD